MTVNKKAAYVLALSAICTSIALSLFLWHKILRAPHAGIVSVQLQHDDVVFTPDPSMGTNTMDKNGRTQYFLTPGHHGAWGSVTEVCQNDLCAPCDIPHPWGTDITVKEEGTLTLDLTQQAISHALECLSTAFFQKEFSAKPEVQSCKDEKNKSWKTHLCILLNPSSNPDAKPEWLKRCKANADCATECGGGPGMCLQDKDDPKKKYGACVCPT